MTARALAIFEGALGADHRQSALTAGQLAVLELADGNEEAAESLYARLRDIQRVTGEPILDILRGHPEFNALEEVLEERRGQD
jgi:hypothetical protein